jgi:dTMP kinase
MKRKSGIFITLEGPDGSGKSTQSKLLAQRLKRNKIPCVLTREPGGGGPGSLSEKIRGLLLASGKRPMAPETELLLFLAARAQHVSDLIRPALRAGKVVVCERFADATWAYQVGGRGLPGEFVTSANRFATQGLQPLLTLLLDVPPALGLRRAFQAKTGHDRIEAESLRFHQGVRRAYLQLAAAEPKRFRVFPADRPPAWVSERIWEAVSEQLRRRGRHASA